MKEGPSNAIIVTLIDAKIYLVLIRLRIRLSIRMLLINLIDMPFFS